MSDIPKLILNVADAAQMLCCQPSTIREHARTGALPGVKIGEDWVFPLSSLVDAVTGMAAEQAQLRRTPPKVTLMQVEKTQGTAPRCNSRTRPLPDLSAFASAFPSVAAA